MEHFRTWERRSRFAGAGIRRHAPTVAVVGVLALTTVGASLAAARDVRETHRRILEGHARDVGTAIEAVSERFSSILSTAALAAGQDHVSQGTFERLVSKRIESSAIGTVAVVAVERAGARVVTRVGSRAPVVIPMVEQATWRRLAALPIGEPRLVKVARTGRGIVVGIAGRAAGPAGCVVFAELSITDAVAGPFSSVTNFDAAVYMPPVESPVTLLGANTEDLPIGGARVTRRIKLEDLPGLLVIRARTPLVGSVSARTPWIALGIGSAITLAMGLVTARQRRRRDEALRLAGEMRHEAEIDALTGLGNRRRVVQALADALGASPGRTTGVLVANLDDFKSVNDGQGRAAGDDLLREVASRLDHEADGAVCARLDGDTFAMVLAGERLGSESGAEDLAARIDSALAEPFVVGGREVFVRASLGFAFDDGRADPEEILRGAHVAMHVAKGRPVGRRFERFRPELLDAARARGDLRTDLRGAIEREELELHYQPIVRLDDRRVVAVEALLRWRHEDGSVTSPADFVPVAEESGLIVPLGRWVARTACRDLGRLRRVEPDLMVSINVSGRQLQDEGFVPMIQAAIAAGGVEPGAVIVEVTESVLVHDAAEAGLLESLNAAGVRMAIDDFGSGYSSLEYLRRMPLDVLKIDRAFVRTDGGNVNPAFLEAITALAQSLDVVTVAEGIETEADRALAEFAGCDWGQGYLMHRPVPVDALERVLQGRVVAEPGSAGTATLRG